MIQAQDGICRNQNRHALFLALTRSQEQDPAAVRAILAQIPERITDLSNTYPEADLSGTIAIGATYWDTLYPQQRPAELTPFKAIAAENRHAPATPFDLHLHIHSERHDLNFELARELTNLLADGFRVMEDIHGFRYLDSRDLTGFVDGTENPQGADRSKVALVSEDGPFNGGSYLHIQRYVHNLEAWQKLDVAEQERIIGRTKDKDIEFPSAEKSPHAHTKRTSLKDEHGKSIEILRHSMPYGDMTEHGLYFVSYCKKPAPFVLMLESMIHGDEDGHHDQLLNFSQAVTGAAFFVPPTSFLSENI